jgi:two-component system, NtrC family, sensor kinase
MAVAKPFRYAALATLVILAFGGWLYLYFKARAVDLRAANGVMAGLRELKEADRRWNDWLIGTYLAPGPAESRRRSTVEPTKLARIHATLAVQVFSLDNPLPPAALRSLKEAFDGKAVAVAAFGAANAAQREAGTAYLSANDAFQATARESTAGAGPAVARDAERMHEAVLLVVAKPEPAAATVADRAIAQLSAAEVPPLTRIELDRLTAAARRAVETRLAEDRRFREAFFASTGPRVDAALRDFERGFGAALDEAERFRIYLLVYSGLLLLIAFWLTWRLTDTYRAIGKLNRKLSEANELLEQRVKERTRDLRQALEDLKEQEALLIQSEKMSSLGQMVAGVAHEVNTPLAYVRSSLESVRGRMPKVAVALAEVEQLVRLLESDETDEGELARRFATVSVALAEVRGRGSLSDLDSAVKDGLYGVGQIGELITNLRNFARLDRSKIAEFDLNEGLAAALAIARSVLKGRSVKQDLGRIAKVACAPSQINQVFLNLLTNAAQATPEGGEIRVRTYQIDSAHVAVEVADNGYGIPQEALPKIFDPFYTTKEVGNKGTGLGLAIAYKIVASHGGRIEVESKVGLGTHFTVTLPLTAVAMSPEVVAA